MSNTSCKPSTTQVLGPILDGDEVIIAALSSDGTTLESIVPRVSPQSGGNVNVIPEFTYFTTDDARSVANADSTEISDDYPKFNIWYLSDSPEEQPDIQGTNPLVFFTFKNGSAVNAGVSCNGDCTGVVPDQSLKFPGISATYYPPAAGSKATPETRFLAPGKPTPLQLVAKNEERSW